MKRIAGFVVGLASFVLLGAQAAALPPDVRTVDLQAACHEPPRPDLREIRRKLLAGRPSAEFTLDHRIPRALGGSDDPSNLWLETVENAIAKDDVERQYITMVCYRHEISVPDAQAYFRSWED